MKLAKLPYDPSALLEFFQEGMEALGAVCERTWHDQVHLVAEGRAAQLWNSDGQLLETEIHFPPPSSTGPRDARTEVFPGCPLIFHLVEALSPSLLALPRVALRATDATKPPPLAVAEKLWHSQLPETTHWKLESPFQAGWHCSLLTLLRCEIQAIDQHWSLHRLVISLPDGQPDAGLASTLEFAEFASGLAAPVPWPESTPPAWQQLIRAALLSELESDLAVIRQRQENFLRRELERIDDYFEQYERELTERLKRQQRAETKVKSEERLAAARGEHQRQRQDQVHRHEIRVIPHLDALVLLAEPAWSVQVAFTRQGAAQHHEAMFVPRARRWILLSPGGATPGQSAATISEAGGA